MARRGSIASTRTPWYVNATVKIPWLLFAVAAGCAQADSAIYRVTTSTNVTIINYDGASITATANTPLTSFDVERAIAPSGEWLPVASGTGSTATVSAPAPIGRSFGLGFTPFPYGIGTNMADILLVMSNVYGMIEANGDMVCHHFDSGVPWPEMLAGAPFPTNMLGDLQFRLDHTPEGHAVFLQVTAMDLFRTGLAPYRGEQESLPLPAPWDTYSFDHPDVREAYYQYCRRMIEFFNPAWAGIGIEVNLLMNNSPTQWNAYVSLHTGTYARLKADFPQLPIAVSMTGLDLIEGYTDSIHTQQLAAVQSLTNHMDYFGLSYHPIMSALLAETVPSMELTQEVMGLTGKPVAICETSYPAEAFTLNGGTLTFNGSPQKQARFFQNLFRALHTREALFVVNFITIDYDQLWGEIGQPDDYTKIWKDTGLLDGTLAPREALRIWRGQLALPWD